MKSEPASSEVAVTVVTIFFNGETFLDEAVHSVLSQTFAAWELILVDDGSTDRSSDIARQYAVRYPEKIRLVEHAGHQNRGMSASRNLGIRAGRGKYIALLDCDDVWHPEKLARQVEILDRHGEAAIVYNATMRWFSWTGKPKDAAKDEPRPLGVAPGRLVYPPEMIPRFLRDEGQTPATCSILIRREAIESVGGFEEAFQSLYEDQAFFYKLFLRQVAFVQRGHWDWYRQHPESCCQIASGGTGMTPLHPVHGKFLDWFAHYLAATGIYDSSVDAALERALRPFHQPWRYRAEHALATAWGTIVRGGLTDWLRLLAGRVARKVLPAGVYQRLRDACHGRAR